MTCVLVVFVVVVVALVSLSGLVYSLAVFMKSHLGVLETQETHVVLLAGMEYLVSVG